MRLAQIGVIVAQTVIVKSRRPICDERNQEQHGREHPGSQPKCATVSGVRGDLAAGYRDSRFWECFSQDCFRNAHGLQNS